MQNLFDIVTSPIAIVIYFAILLAVMIGLVLSLFSKDSKRTSNTITENTMHSSNKNESAKFSDHKNRKGEREDEEVREIMKQEQKDIIGEGEGETRRFFMLSEIDDNRGLYKRSGNSSDNKMRNEKEISLKELCEDFRNFAAYSLGLYYHISDIRQFISGLLTSYIVILQGVSGTGKTSLAYAFGEFLSNTTTVIPVQPMWKERSGRRGYYKEFTKRFNETTL